MKACFHRKTSTNPVATFSFGLLSFLVFAATVMMSTASAGTPSEELTKCMISNASPSERFDTALVTWVAASYHPSMPPDLRVPAKSKELIYRRVGKLLDRLLLEACPDKARAAVSSEGVARLASALHAFWGSGTVELNQSKEATSAFSEIWSYANGNKISSVLRTK